jgi:2-polyprenyl-3-methyl-5-hydroxy-6-metoxy-1,4-benzoquinol methylase
MMSQQVLCWCGNRNLDEFSVDYKHCSVCESLVYTHPVDINITKITNDNQNFYGRAYWFSHQKTDLDQPDIISRSRLDISERCLHWLRTVLKYKLMPAQMVELGCAHGGFVAILRQAGYDAMGLELSPWIVEFARQTFNIPVLLGPIEEQPIDPDSLDAILLMDVLEHLQDPLKTMHYCLELLKQDGILIIQTPKFPEGANFSTLVQQKSLFLKQLKPIDHLYLFSETAVKTFFNRLGAEYISFELPIYPQYDMFLVVSRIPLKPNTISEIEKALMNTKQGWIIQTMLDLDEKYKQLGTNYEVVETDRAARLELINHLDGIIQKQNRVLKWLPQNIVRRAMRRSGPHHDLPGKKA